MINLKKMLQKYIECDFEFNYLDVSRLSFIRKNISITSSYLFNFNFLTSFFFSFCNIINIDFFFIHRFLLVFWIFTGSFGSIINLKINLRLGIHYYHFILKYNMYKRKFFYVLSFLVDEFNSHQPSVGFKILNTIDFMLFWKNLEVFTNYKLARGVYFHRIQKKFFLFLTLNKILSYFFKVFLTNLKLYVI